MTTTKKKTIVLYDNHNINYNDYLECYKDNGNDSELEDSEILDSQDFLEYVNDSLNYFWDDFISQLDYFTAQAQDYCLITGDLGLWNGKYIIQPEIMDTLQEAIIKCIQNSDYIKIEFNDGVITVYNYHHDGVNLFYLRPLSKKAINILQESSYYDHEYLAEKFAAKKYYTKNYKLNY